jgi:1,2-phenylacetyl-CoA epoxidase PaaB subunit
MNLRRKTTAATAPITSSSGEVDNRLDELWRVMKQTGITSMSTEELEEWTRLMAKSLEGKGDGPLRKVSTKRAKRV